VTTAVPLRRESSETSPVPNQALRQAADRVVEACCIVAILSLPLYFSVLTNTGYEPDKAVLLRVFATIACGAWLVSTALDPQRTFRLAARNWILLLGCAVFLTYALATVFSIEPSLSLWGSSGRQEGQWTRVSYLVFFVIAATRLRRPAQWNRLITALVLSSLPAVVYGILQQFGLDPIPNAGDPSSLQFSVRSTLGQHVFFASYLIMVIPFTAAGVLRNREWRTAPVRKSQGDETLLIITTAIFVVLTFIAFAALGYRRPGLFALFPGLLAGYVLLGLMIEELPEAVAVRRARFVWYSTLLVLQIVTLGLTGARGAWLAAFASVPVFGFLVARRLRLRQISYLVLAVSIALGLFVGLLNVPNGPLQRLRTVHSLSRLANIAESAGGGGSGQGRLFIWEGVVDLMSRHPAIGGSWGGAGRDLVGYGPETLHDSFQAVFPLQLRQATSEIWVWDRAHNIFLDDLADAGFLGLASTLLLLVFVFWRILRLLEGVDDATALLLIAGGAALAAHLVDGLFGLETPVTLLMMWLIAGLCAGLHPGAEEATQEDSRLSSMRPTLTFWAILLPVMIVVALVQSMTSSPALLAALWLLSAGVGVGAVAWALFPRRIPEEAVQPSRGRKKGARPASTKPTPTLPTAGRAFLVAPAVLALGAAVVLGSQMESQTAAIAARNGLTSNGLRQDQDAIRYLQQAVRADPSLAIYKMELGGEYEKLGEARSASADTGYRPRPGDEQTIDPQTALTLGRDQLFTLAENALQSARTIAPDDPDAYNNLGTLYQQWNRPIQAVAMFQHAESLSIQNPTYLDRISLSLLTAHRIQEAYANARNAVGLDTAYWYSHYALALVEHRLGARTQASQDASIALVTVHNFWPPPPDSELAQMRTIQREG